MELWQQENGKNKLQENQISVNIVYNKKGLYNNNNNKDVPNRPLGSPLHSWIPHQNAMKTIHTVSEIREVADCHGNRVTC